MLPAPGGAGVVNPHVVQTGKLPINWTQFNDPASGFGIAWTVAVGSDKNIYFGNNQGGLTQVQMSGKTKNIPMTYVCSGSSNCNFAPGYSMTVGADKKFYMLGNNFDYNNNLYVMGVASTTGSLTVHDIKSGDLGSEGGLTLGPDGNVWFIEQKHVANITTGGHITEFAYPSGATSNSFGGITTGPDGNVWFTEYNNNIIAKIVPSTGAITEFSLTSQGLSCSPSSIISANGGLFFVCNGSYVGEMTTSGTAKIFYDAFGVSYFPQTLQMGADGNPWFADGNGAYISEFNLANPSFTIYVPPYSTGTVYQSVLGPDGNFWGQESDNKIDVYIPNPLTVSPATLSMHVGDVKNLTVTENGTASWTAVSSSPGVASVVQGGHANTFVVTANGLGKTKITIKDAVGNSFVVNVTVN
jgi:hypothetical protein